MQIETYEIEEVNSEIAEMAADSEAGELIAKLGLDGQKNLFNADTATRLPYRRLTEEEDFVYSVLCPVKSPLEKFGSEIIPLRVLQVAAHAKECGFFKRIEVWSPKMASVKDPVLVGIKAGVSYGEEEFILARWGKELDPIEKMIPVARRVWADRTLAALQGIASDVQQHMAKVTAMAGINAIPKSIQEPSFYYSL